MNKVVIFSAPSGSGKTTLVKHCLDKFPNLKFSVSATTRSLRGDEKHGKDYFFLSVEEFKTKIKQNEFIEYEEVYKDNYYGTLKAEVEKIWNRGEIVIFDVDVKGGMNLKKIFGSQALAVFIAPPSVEELYQRLENRGTDSPEVIKTRIAKVNEELSYSRYFDKSIVNENLEIAKKEIENLVRNFIFQ